MVKVILLKFKLLFAAALFKSLQCFASPSVKKPSPSNGLSRSMWSSLPLLHPQPVSVFTHLLSCRHSEHWNTWIMLRLQAFRTLYSLCLRCLFPECAYGLFPYLQGLYSNVTVSLGSSLPTLCKIIHLWNHLSSFFVLFFYTSGFIK